MAIARSLKWTSTLCGLFEDKTDGDSKPSEETYASIKEERLAAMLENEVNFTFVF